MGLSMGDRNGEVTLLARRGSTVLQQVNHTCESSKTFAGKAVDDVTTGASVDTGLTGAFVYLRTTLAPGEARLAETAKLVF